MWCKSICYFLKLHVHVFHVILRDTKKRTDIDCQCSVCVIMCFHHYLINRISHVSPVQNPISLYRTKPLLYCLL